MADRIELRGLRCRGFHGVFSEEKRDGQDFICDITCWLDFPTTDDLSGTVNYAELAELAHSILSGPARDLIETVANEIAETIMYRFDLLHAVEVTVHKPQAPIPLDFQDVSVVARRSRNHMRTLSPRTIPAAEAEGPLRAVLSIGSNMADREAMLHSVAEEFRGQIIAASSLYKTTPWGETDQPDFLNAVIIVEVPGTALKLLHRGQALEAAAHRTREKHWGPRTLDVDIVTVTDAKGRELISETEELRLPHPYASARAFVCLPWLEADPSARLSGQAVAQLLKAEELQEDLQAMEKLKQDWL